jgi:hypothetical protein
MTNTQTNTHEGCDTTKRGSKISQIQNPELLMTTAGGKIRCRRCVGVSSRTKKQCGHPALKTSKASRCKWHAGASTGPRTKEGVEAIQKANTTFGHFTKKAIVERRKKFAELHKIAELLKTVWQS